MKKGRWALCHVDVLHLPHNGGYCGHGTMRRVEHSGRSTNLRVAQQTVTGAIFGLLAMASAAAGTDGRQPVYKCTINGSISYSSEPCIDAIEVDVTPTRGLDKSTGHTRIGADVSREKLTEGLATALRPVTSLNPAEYVTARRRNQLPATSQQECKTLDAGIASGAAATADAVLRMRRRKYELGC